jgi:hypothetical protein
MVGFSAKDSRPQALSMNRARTGGFFSVSGVLLIIFCCCCYYYYYYYYYYYLFYRSSLISALVLYKLRRHFFIDIFVFINIFLA